MSKLNEHFKIAKQTRFAILGRELADAAIAGRSIATHQAEAARLRRAEQDSADASTRIAALARQVGDAIRTGADTAPIVSQLVALRKVERGAAADPTISLMRR